ncbi:MAG: threonine/serine exporter family protein [Christensenellaceae bacterium]|nr:threonine/serine exporter family protein [Christensenellaceae bacterium]
MNYEELLEFSIAFAARLQKCGAETYRVEETIIRIVEAYGVKKVDTFVIPGCIMASLETDDGRVFSKIRRIKDCDTILDGVEKYNALCRKICYETPPLHEAKHMLNTATADVRHYNTLVYHLASFVTAAGFAIFFGGTLSDAICSGVCGLATGLCLKFMSAFHANPFFKTVVAGFILGTISHALAALELCMNADMVSIGAIMLLVPGFLFTNSMRDIIYGDTMSGVNRLVQVLIIAAAIVVGTGAAVSFSIRLFGEVNGSILVVQHSLFIECIAGMIGTFGFGLIMNIHGAGMLLCILGGAISWLVYRICSFFGFNDPTCFFIASAAASIYAEIMARVRKYPTISYLMASLVPLIPGAGIYYTMSFVAHGDVAQFWSRGTSTAAAAGALAVGVLLVSTVYRMWGVWIKRRKERAELKQTAK